MFCSDVYSTWNLWGRRGRRKRTFSIQMCIPPWMWFEYGFHLESASSKKNILQFKCGLHFGLCFRCGILHLVSVPHVDYRLESASRKLKKNTIFQFRFGLESGSLTLENNKTKKKKKEEFCCCTQKTNKELSLARSLAYLTFSEEIRFHGDGLETRSTVRICIPVGWSSEARNRQQISWQAAAATQVCILWVEEAAAAAAAGSGES